MSVSGYSISNKQLLMSNPGDTECNSQHADVIANIIENYFDDVEVVRWLEISDITDGITLTYRDYSDDVHTVTDVSVTSTLPLCENKGKPDPKFNIIFSDETIIITMHDNCISYELMNKIIDMIASRVVDEGLCNYAMALRNKLSIFYDEIYRHTYDLIDISKFRHDPHSSNVALYRMTLHSNYIMIAVYKFKISQELNDYIRNNPDESGKINRDCELSVSKMLTIQIEQIFKGIPLISQNKSAVKK